MNIIHCDLKPENKLIVKSEKDGFYQIKIIDLRTAKVFQKKAEFVLISSAYYIAPEVLLNFLIKLIK